MTEDSKEWVNVLANAHLFSDVGVTLERQHSLSW